MHIHIHQLGRHFQRQHTAGELALHQGAPIGVFQRGHHGAVLDETPVDEEELHAAAGPAGPGRCDKAGHPVAAALVLHRQKVLCKVPAKHGVDRALETAVSRRFVKLFSFADERNGHFRVGKGDAADRLAHERALAGVLFQELHPGGGVIEQVPHGDGGAHRARARLHAQFLAALDAVAAGELVRLGAGEHLHPCHTGN